MATAKKTVTASKTKTAKKTATPKAAASKKAAPKKAAAAEGDQDRKGLAAKARQLKLELAAIRFNLQSPSLKEFRLKKAELVGVLSQLG